MANTGIHPSLTRSSVGSNTPWIIQPHLISRFDLFATRDIEAVYMECYKFLLWGRGITVGKVLEWATVKGVQKRTDSGT